MSIRQLAGLPMILGSLMFCPGKGWAAVWQQVVSARTATEYDTNPAMTTAYHDAIWRTTFDPSYTLTGTADVNEYTVGLAGHFARVSNKTLSQNRDDPSAFLNWQHQNETGALGVAARYDEASTRIAEFNGSGLVAVDGTRASRTVSANWSNALGERSTLAVDGAHTDISYQGGSYADYVTQSGNVSYNYAWSEHSKPFIKISYVDYAPAGNGPINRRTSAMAGMIQKVSAQLDWSMQAGQSRSNGADSSRTTQGEAGLNYTGQLTQLALKTGRQVAPSGLGGFIIADHVNGSGSYDVSALSKLGLDLAWQKNKFITATLNRTAGIWLQHELNALWAMRLYGQHKISGQYGANSASSNILGLSVTYINPDF